VMMANRTRGVRGGSELSRTLHERPATASLHSATPKRKMSFPFSEKIGRAQIRKARNIFSFRGSALQVFGQLAGLQFGLAVLHRLAFCTAPRAPDGALQNKDIVSSIFDFAPNPSIS